MQSEPIHQQHSVAQLEQYPKFMTSLKAQSSLGVVIVEKIALIIQKYAQLAPELAKKQEELKVLYQYNQKLVEILEKFGEHEKRIITRMTTLEQINIRFSKEYCLSRNKAYKLDETYRPISPVYPNYRVSDWKFMIEKQTEQEIEPEYQHRLLEMFKSYILPKETVLESVILGKLKEFCIEFEPSSFEKANGQSSNMSLGLKTMGGENGKGSILQRLLVKIQEYNRKRQSVDENTMFDLFAERRDLYDQSAQIDLVERWNNPTDEENMFVHEVAKLHAKLEHIPETELAELIKKERENQKMLRRQKIRELDRYEIVIGKIVTENCELKEDSEKLRKELSSNEEEMRLVRSKLKEKSAQLEYKSMRKLARSNSISSIGSMSMITEEVNTEEAHRLRDLNKILSSRMEDLKAKCEQVTLELKDIRTKNEDDQQPIEVYLLTFPMPILVIKELDVSMAPKSVQKIQRKLMEVGINVDMDISEEILVDQAIQAIAGQPKQMEENMKSLEGHIQQIQEQVIQQEKMIEEKELIAKNAEQALQTVTKTYTVEKKRMIEEQEALQAVTVEVKSRMAKSERLVCSTTNTLLETALNGPKSVIKEIEANLQQLRRLLDINTMPMIMPERQPVSPGRSKLQIVHKLSLPLPLQNEMSFNRENQADGDSLSQNDHSSKNVVEKQKSSGQEIRGRVDSIATKTVQNDASPVDPIRNYMIMKDTIPPKQIAGNQRNVLAIRGSAIQGNRIPSDMQSLSQSQEVHRDNLNDYATYDQESSGQNDHQKTPRKKYPQVPGYVEIIASETYGVAKKETFVKEEGNFNREAAQTVKIDFELGKREQEIESDLSGIPDTRIGKAKANGNDSVTQMLNMGRSESESLLENINENPLKTSNRSEIRIVSATSNNEDMAELQIELTESKDAESKYPSHNQCSEIASRNFLNGLYPVDSSESPESKANPKSQLRSESESAFLRKNYDDLMKKKELLDKKLEIDTDQIEIEEMLRKYNAMREALDQSERIHRENQLQYQAFIQELEEEGTLSEKKPELQTYYLTRHVSELKIRLDEQKQQFESKIVSTITNSERMAESIMVQFREMQESGVY